MTSARLDDGGLPPVIDGLLFAQEGGDGLEGHAEADGLPVAQSALYADSAVMVIDAAKGIEPQTRKLFKVCAMRDIPIFTFINKLDREAAASGILLAAARRSRGTPLPHDAETPQ